MNQSPQDTPLILITDGSVDTQTKTGVGAYLLATDGYSFSDASISPIETKQFENTSSTKLELQALLWALESISPTNRQIHIYTDSQNIIGLPGRRERLTRNDYRSKRGEPIRNEQLYRDFFAAIDSLYCRFFKVRGHQPKVGKNEIDRLFTLVDRTTRNALRQQRALNRSYEKSD